MLKKDRTHRLALILISTLLIYSIPAKSADQTPSTTEDYLNMSLDDLLKVKVTVATQKPVTTRDSPGIITVVTDTEIRNMGARDLIDVLQMVPGIAFGLDVEGVTDIGIRGNWAHEGKSLLIIDDHEMNELSYSTNQFGNHYPVDQIKKIEIIRGPGSVIYGGHAELAVIKITTKSAEELNGADASFKYGQMTSTFGRADLGLQAGKVLGDFSFKVGAFVGTGNRSDRTFTDLYGSQFNMGGNSKLNPTFINTDLSYKGLDIKFLFDHYVMTYQDGYSFALPYPVGMNFDSYLTKIKYDFKPLENLVVTPSLTFDRTQPWDTEGPEGIRLQNMTDLAGNSLFQPGSIAYSRRTDRVKATVLASYDLTETINLLAGIDKTYFGGHDNFGTFATTGTNSVSYNSSALYAQGVWSSKIVNLTVGARYETHNQFGSAFVPRAALTKVIDNLHFKLLASSAFRAPAIENIESNQAIQPEKTTIYELETGYRFSKEFFLTSNIFDITIYNPIVYSVTTSATNYYANYDQTGSRGLEVELRYVIKDFYATLGYSFYSSAGKNTVPAYAVPGRGDISLGLPAHKLTLNSNYRIVGNLSVNPSIVFLGTRYGYDYAGVPSSPYVNINAATQSAVLTNFEPTWLLNTYFNYKDLLLKNLNAGIGVFNLLNQNYRFIQPYYVAQNAHAPLPSPSREFVIDLSYHYGL